MIASVEAFFAITVIDAIEKNKHTNTNSTKTNCHLKFIVDTI